MGGAFDLDGDDAVDLIDFWVGGGGGENMGGGNPFVIASARAFLLASLRAFLAATRSTFVRMVLSEEDI